jgi:hypothetical protein
MVQPRHRRPADGSIDFAFYRCAAQRRRRRMKRLVFRRCASAIVRAVRLVVAALAPRAGPRRKSAGGSAAPW